MARSRGFSWSSAFIGAAATLFLLLLIAGIMIGGGLYPVGASSQHTKLVEALLGATRDRGVQHAASGLKAPNLSPADIAEGGSHFKGMCQTCHGGPGVEPAEFAAGMNPRPPDLAEATHDLSVPQIFWIAKNGFKMTGMPGFGKTDSDEELWEVAAFAKSLKTVSAADYAKLPNAHEREMEEGDRPVATAHAH